MHVFDIIFFFRIYHDNSYDKTGFCRLFNYDLQFRTLQAQNII